MTMVFDHDRDSGFTLIEVLVAMIVLGIGVATLMTAFGTQAKTSLNNRNQSAAASLLTAGAEYVKGLNWSAATANCGSGSPTDITSQVQTTPDLKFTVTYGPAQPPSAQNPPLTTFGVSDSTCKNLAIVPVKVDNPTAGYHLTVNVMKRPADETP